MSDMLDLEALAGIASSARGRKPSACSFALVRDLGAEDLPNLNAPPKLEVAPTLIKSLRNTHHTLARLLAEGRKQVEVCAITGYSQSRISILMDDPAFVELVEYYKVQKDKIYLDVHERLAGLGTMALEVIQERLEEDPSGFKNSDLLNVAEMALDRSVAPPKGGIGVKGNAALAMPSVQVNVSFVKHEALAEPEIKLVTGEEIYEEE